VDVITAVRAAPGRSLSVDVLRGRDPLQLSLAPAAETAPSADGKGTVTVGKIGVLFARSPDMIEVAWSPLEALAKAPGKVWDTCVMQARMIRKMIVGEASVKNLTGPLTIADYAGKTARMGPVEFIGFIAFVSVGLGFMNLLPIPVLDGGHLLYYSLEVLTGRPLPERVSDIMQRLGVGMLVALMMLAVFNDVARLL
jgi:regulator of sigma E protease